MHFQPGQQIAYVPPHAFGDTSHPDVMFGFVTSSNHRLTFCRFWQSRSSRHLRTKCCSEPCSTNSLTPYNSHPQPEVDLILNAILRSMN